MRGKKWTAEALQEAVNRWNKGQAIYVTSLLSRKGKTTLTFEAEGQGWTAIPSTEPKSRGRTRLTQPVNDLWIQLPGKLKIEVAKGEVVSVDLEVDAETLQEGATFARQALQDGTFHIVVDGWGRKCAVRKFFNNLID
jgi:hypothetical protein